MRFLHTSHQDISITDGVRLMFERVVHWIIFLSLCAGLLGALIQLIATGEISEPCCMY
jgi:hypothetical protein